RHTILLSSISSDVPISSLFLSSSHLFLFLFFFNDTATTEIYTLSLHDALPISITAWSAKVATSSICFSENGRTVLRINIMKPTRSEEHTSELQSRGHLVCRLLLEKKKKKEEIIENITQSLNRRWSHVTYVILLS